MTVDMSDSGTDQRALIDRCRDGDRSAFEGLYAAHARIVIAYLLRSGFQPPDAEDLLQETFLRAYRSLGTYDPEKGSFRLWVSTIARNVARRHWARRAGPECFDPDLAEDVFADEQAVGSELAAAREARQAVTDCVSALPEDLQRIIRLRYVDGRTTRGIADTVEMPEATVRLRLTGAHGLLERCLKGKGILR